MSLPHSSRPDPLFDLNCLSQHFSTASPCKLCASRSYAISNRYIAISATLPHDMDATMSLATGRAQRLVPARPRGCRMLTLSSGDLHLLKAPSIIKHQAMIKARSRQRHRLLVISGTAVQPYRYSSALHARGGRG